MAVRIIRNWWWVDFRLGYVRYRKRSPENSKAGARAYEASLRQRLARGEKIDSPKFEKQTFAQFAETWFTTYVVTNNKPSEQQTKRCYLQSSIVPFFAKTGLDAIGKREIELFKVSEQRRGLSNKTINNKLGVLRKCLASAYEWGAMPNPPPTIKALKCTPPVSTFLTRAEADSLLSHASGIVYEMILTALRTGIRQGEVRGLQWGDIDWENRTLTVRHAFCEYTQNLTTPKSNRERHVPLADDLYEVLLARRALSGYVFTNERGRPFPQRTHLRCLRQVQERAGLKSIGWHTLRHTFASHLADKVSLRTVQELLGHSTITMTMRYSHVAAPQLRSAIDLLCAERSPSTDFGHPVGNAMSTI